MKISAIKQYNINFKNNENNIIGYDDEISRERRELIRENYERENMPYHSIYEKEPRLEEYELNKMLSFFINKPKKIDGDKMTELPISNLRNISQSSRYTPNIYRGATLYDAPDWVLEGIKDAGLKTVVNLGEYGNIYKEKIENAGLEYVDYDVSHYLINGGIWRTPASMDEKKNKLIEFIKTMQKEYCYIGCEFGTYKTDAAVYMNNLFNPKVKISCRIYSPQMVSYVPYMARKIYENMTPEDKRAIGWTPEFEEKFKEKIAIH